MKRVLVTGGRSYNDSDLVYRTLDGMVTVDGVSAVIVGDAHGADDLAREWAWARGVPLTICAADWRKHGRAAGPIRNREMLGHRPDVVVAFPGGKGTADMVRQAQRAGIAIVRAGRWP